MIPEPQVQKNCGGGAQVFEMSYKRVSHYSQPSDHANMLVTTPNVKASLVNRWHLFRSHSAEDSTAISLGGSIASAMSMILFPPKPGPFPTRSLSLISPFAWLRI